MSGGHLNIQVQQHECILCMDLSGPVLLPGEAYIQQSRGSRLALLVLTQPEVAGSGAAEVQGMG